MKLTGKTEVLGGIPVTVPLYPPQIPHGLTRDRTRASAVRGRRLTALAMARPISEVTYLGHTAVLGCPNTETSLNIALLSAIGLLGFHFIAYLLHYISV